VNACTSALVPPAETDESARLFTLDDCAAGGEVVSGGTARCSGGCDAGLTGGVDAHPARTVTMLIAMAMGIFFIGS
jgi:hypothetical protein